MKINTHLHFHGLRIAVEATNALTINQALTNMRRFFEECVFFATTVALLALLLWRFWSHL